MRGLLTAEYQGLTKLKFLSAGGFVFPHSDISISRLEALQAALPQIAFLLERLVLLFNVYKKVKDRPFCFEFILELFRSSLFLDAPVSYLVGKPESKCLSCSCMSL